MKKHRYDNFQELLYSESLDNGLEVIIWPKPDFVNSILFLATPFGALTLREKVGEEEYVFHSGIAHFLEHKVFESEDHHDVMEDFSRLGAQVNAFTSYMETCYYFSTPNKDISEPLNMLLDFVQTFSCEKKAVQKEKDIIIQEYRMYLQIPEVRLGMELLKALYHNIPINQDISGDEANIKAITKAELERAHAINYHPANMVLIAVSAVAPEEILHIIKENQAAKNFPPLLKAEKIPEAEPVEVVESYREIKLGLSQPKIAVGYKLPAYGGSKQEIAKADLMFRLWLTAYFSSLNPAYQKWLDAKLINDSFSYEGMIADEYALLMISGEDLNSDFVATFDAYLQELLNRPFSAKVLDQLKKRYIGKTLQNLNNAESIAVNTLRYGWWDYKYLDIPEVLDALTVEDMAKLQKYLNWSQRAVVKII